MKNKLYYFYFLILLAGLFSCGKSEDKPVVDYIPVQESKGYKWGMLGPDGKMLFDNEFDREPSLSINGVFSVRENKGFSLYKSLEKPMLIPGCEDLKDVGTYSDGLIPIVRENERITLININGETKLTLEPINGYEVSRCIAGFNSGVLMIGLQNGKWGAINTKGEVVIKPIYESLYRYSEGICMGKLSVDKEDSKFNIVALDKNGKEIFKLNEDYILTENKYFVGDRLTVKKGDVLGYVDKKGDFTKLPAKYAGYEPLSDKFFAFKNSDDKWGIVDKNNEIMVRAKYDYVTYVDGNIFFVKNGDNYQLINSEADVIKKFDEKEMLNFHALAWPSYNMLFWYAGGEDNSITFFNKEGNPITKTDFYNIGLGIGNGLIILSDYFDLSGAVENIVDRISDSGIQEAKLGSPMKNYATSNISQYVGRSTIDVDVANFNFNKASLKTCLISFDNIAYEEPVYTYETVGYYRYRYLDRYEKHWNPNSKVNEIEMTLTGPHSIFEQGKKRFTALLNNKGYKPIEDKDAYTVLYKDDSYIIIWCPANLNKIGISLLKESTYKTYKMSYFENQYKKAQDQVASIVAEPADVDSAPVDIAAIEEVVDSY